MFLQMRTSASLSLDMQKACFAMAKIPEVAGQDQHTLFFLRVLLVGIGYIAAAQKLSSTVSCKSGLLPYLLPGSRAGPAKSLTLVKNS